MNRVIGIVLFNGSEELDWAGPWEVFTAGAKDGDRVVTVAESLDVVTCAKGLRVLPDHSFEDCPPLDVLLVPGGLGSRMEMHNPAMLEFVRRQDVHTEWTTSVCTGAFVLYKTGLLDGKRATTHWAAIDELLGHAPELDLDRDARWVVQGKIVTSAGVSAGIDMSLWILGQLHGIEHARTTQRYMQYEPDPPYQD